MLYDVELNDIVKVAENVKKELIAKGHKDVQIDYEQLTKDFIKDHVYLCHAKVTSEKVIINITIYHDGKCRYNITGQSPQFSFNLTANKRSKIRKAGCAFLYDNNFHCYALDLSSQAFRMLLNHM